MGTIQQAEPVKLICGMIFSDDSSAEAAREELTGRYGPIDDQTDVIPFDFTDYYDDEMGGALKRQLFAFERLIGPEQLAAIKIQTNAIEVALGTPSGDGVRRTVNLDPGYLEASKLVLATTKNFAHRVYLGDGIYAEVTLRFKRGGCEFFDWTYPDYRSDLHTEFLLRVRQRYLDAFE